MGQRQSLGHGLNVTFLGHSCWGCALPTAAGCAGVQVSRALGGGPSPPCRHSAKCVGGALSGHCGHLPAVHLQKSDVAGQAEGPP